MNEAEWHDGDCPKVRKLCGNQLRAHVSYQDGRHSEAPALIFADADYEVGDGKCGLHVDGKSANEPAIVYARIDSLIDASARIETLEAAIKRQAGAAATLRQHTLAEVQHLKDLDRSEYNAAKTLDSEREANAILTEQLQAAEARVAKLEAGLGAIARAALERAADVAGNAFAPSDMGGDLICEPHQSEMTARAIRALAKDPAALAAIVKGAGEVYRL